MFFQYSRYWRNLKGKIHRNSWNIYKKKAAIKWTIPDVNHGIFHWNSFPQGIHKGFQQPENRLNRSFPHFQPSFPLYYKNSCEVSKKPQYLWYKTMWKMWKTLLWKIALDKRIKWSFQTKIGCRLWKGSGPVAKGRQPKGNWSGAYRQ